MPCLYHVVITFQIMCPQARKASPDLKKKSGHFSLSLVAFDFIDSQVAILPSVHHSHSPFGAFLHISV